MSKKFHNPWDDENEKQSTGQKKDPLEELFNKAKDQLNNLLKDFGKGFNKRPGLPNNDKKTVAYALSGVFALWLLTGFYTTQPDEEGVIIRFGEYVRTTGPGLNYKFPSPIESLTKVSVTRINKEEIGFRSYGNKTLSVQMLRENTIANESQMLTTDENIVDINFEVQWVVNDARNRLLNVLDLPSENTVRSVAESAMREVIGLAKVNDVLSEERSKVEHEAKASMQEMLDNFGMGVKIMRVQLLRVDPPREVIDAYRDVQNAKQDKEREINQSLSYRNDIVPKAKGEAEKIMQDAEGYKQRVVADAVGEANRFSSVYEQYKLAREITRKKMYIETMEEVFGGTDLIILDKGANSVLPYLPVDQKKKDN